MKPMVRMIRKRSRTDALRDPDAGLGRGELVVSLREVNRHFWKYLRLVSRKGLIVKVTSGNPPEPKVVLIPEGGYRMAVHRMSQVRDGQSSP